MRYRLTAVLLGTVLSIPALADFDAGMEAYRFQDYDTAYKEFYQAAIEGDQTAQFNIGVMYYRGQSVAKDLVRAYCWIELAADPDNADDMRVITKLSILLTPDQVQKGQAMAAELASTHGLSYTPSDGDEPIAIANR